jgi:sugar phosphate isomerase/epimerase
VRPDQFGMDTITLAGALSAKLAAVRAAGFAQIMISAKDLASHPDGVDAAVREVRASGLRVSGFQVLRDFEGLGGPLAAYKLGIAKQMLEMAAAIHAPLLLVCSSTSSHASEDVRAMTADLRKLATLAVPLGIRVAYEALSWGRTVNLIEHAWDIVERADCPNLGIVIDSFHWLASDAAPDALEVIDPSKLFFVQLSDFMWRATPSFDERRETARHMRVFPGEGAHGEQLATFVRQIDEMGYEGDYSFEVFNDDYAQMPLAYVSACAMHAVSWALDRVPRRNVPVLRTPANARPDLVALHT